MESTPEQQARFDRARIAATGSRSREGIGRMGERVLHAALKNYYEPNPEKQEVKLGRYVADICNAEGVVEIQTRQWYKLRVKLAAFLPERRVMAVYPVARQKWLIWVNGETGETTKPRRSPKTGTPYELFIELDKLADFWKNPRLTVCVVLLDMEEFRLLDGWSRDKKKGSTRFERVPLKLCGEIRLRGPEDYAALLPEGMPETFTSVDLAKAAKISRRLAQTVLRVMFGTGAVERLGKQGRAILYRRVPPA